MVHELVMGQWVVFGKVIGSIEFALRPVEVELTLCNLIFQPVIPHVKSFGAFHADLGAEYVMRSGVVGFHGIAIGGLRMTKFLESSDERDGILT